MLPGGGGCQLVALQEVFVIAGGHCVAGPGRGKFAPLPAAQLREKVAEAWRIRQFASDRFTWAARILPGLIARVEQATRVQRCGSELRARREVLIGRRPVGAAAAVLLPPGLDLPLLAADRALRAAEDADDPVRIAAAPLEPRSPGLGGQWPKRPRGSCS